MAGVPEASFEVTDEGYFRVLRYSAQNTRVLDDVLRKNRRNVIVAGLIVGSGMVGWGYSRAPDRPVIGLIYASIHGLVFAVIWLVYYLTTQSRGALERRWESAVRRSLANGSLPRPSGMCRIALHPEFATYGCGSTTMTCDWSAIKRVTATRDEVFLDFTDTVIRVPFDALGTDAERLAFLGRLEELARSHGAECPRLI